MWNVHVTAKTYGIRPSELLCIKDEWTAYCFDNAVSLIGNLIENKTSETDDRGRPRYRLQDLLSDEPQNVLDLINQRATGIEGAISHYYVKTKK